MGVNPDNPEAGRGDKYPPIATLSMEDAREILRAGRGADRIGLGEVIRILDCDAQRADEILRAMARAGYLNPDCSSGAVFWWELTSVGLRLAIEKKRKRIDRGKVDATIAELLRRARDINADPDRLHRVTLRLFGSALEHRQDFGDVDVAIAWHQRSLPKQDRARLVAEFERRQPAWERQTFLGRLLGAEEQDKREIRAALKQGLPHLSLMEDDPMDLGTPFRWLVSHDMATDAPAPVSDAIIRPNVPPEFERQDLRPLPPVTILKAQCRQIADRTKVPVEGLHIGPDDAALLEQALWTPAVTRAGGLVPNDLRGDPRMRFAGFQHLCPVWREPLGGIAMLKKSLEWCDDHKVWVRDLPPFVSIHRGDRSHIIRFGHWQDLIYVRMGSKSLLGSLIPVNRTRVSRIDLAGAYAVARSLMNIYREARCAEMPAFTAEILLPQVRLDRLPDLVKLSRAGDLREGAFEGLLRVELTM